MNMNLLCEYYSSELDIIYQYLKVSKYKLIIEYV